MSLEYRSGRFNICYWPQGKAGGIKRAPIPAHIQDHAEAKVFHDAFIADRHAVKSQQTNPRPMTGLTVGKLWDEYLPHYEKHHPPTYPDLKGITKWVKESIGTYPAEDINLQIFEIYKKKRAAVARSKGPGLNRTINKECSYISGFAKWAIKYKHITPRLLSYDTLPYKAPLPKILTVAEIISVLDHAEPFYWLYFSFLYYLGLRSIEVRNLNWSCIDWTNETAEMVQKGGRIKRLPLPPRLLSRLKVIAKQRPPDAPDEPIFLNVDTGRSVRYIRRAIARARKAAGLDKRVTPHLFRHSLGKHMVDRGVPLRDIQEYFGHTQISTTQIYTQVSIGNLRDAQKSIDVESHGLGYLKPANVIEWDTIKNGKPTPP